MRFCAAAQKRKSFDGLHALVREHLELDAFAGHLFVFATPQYALADKARQLGWAKEQVVIIDEDLGLSVVDSGLCSTWSGVDWRT